MLNPIAPPGVYIADPEVRQMPDGRVYDSYNLYLTISTCGWFC